jgi:gamma-glutamylcyclotransferase (GGCT)/AIG2-like uncharacterized protein YtfP
MRGGRNHAKLAPARFVAQAETAPGWELRHLGRYPAMARGAGTVKGEVWHVQAALLAELDAFEEVPALYERATISLVDGSSAEAWIMPAERVAAWPRIAGGAWPVNSGEAIRDVRSAPPLAP